MISLMTVSAAQEQLRSYVKSKRLAVGLTQEGLSIRAGVSLATLRKFEHKGVISLESFLKLLLVLDGLDSIIKATQVQQKSFKSIDEVLQVNEKKQPKRGWRT
ncbi:MAG: XRE family transcriptional regulator [Gammaproteobacteria bacterium]|nr:XRE family transcriptional regulator [Gammaproteobacteria bacterium]